MDTAYPKNDGLLAVNPSGKPSDDLVKMDAIASKGVRGPLPPTIGYVEHKILHTALGFGGGVATGVIHGKDPLQSGLAGGIGAGLSEMVAERYLASVRDKALKDVVDEISKTGTKLDDQQLKDLIRDKVTVIVNSEVRTAGKIGRVAAVGTSFLAGLDPEVANYTANNAIENNLSKFYVPVDKETQDRIDEQVEAIKDSAIVAVKNSIEVGQKIFGTLDGTVDAMEFLALQGLNTGGVYKVAENLERQGYVERVRDGNSEFWLFEGVSYTSPTAFIGKVAVSVMKQKIVEGYQEGLTPSRGVHAAITFFAPVVEEVAIQGVIKCASLAKNVSKGLSKASTLTKEVAPALKTLDQQLAPVLENQGLGLAKSAMKTEVEVGKSLLKEEVGVAKSLTSNELKSVGESLSKPTVEVATQLEFDFVKDVGKTEVGLGKSLTSNESKYVGDELKGVEKVERQLGRGMLNESKYVGDDVLDQIYGLPHSTGTPLHGTISSQKGIEGVKRGSDVFFNTSYSKATGIKGLSNRRPDVIEVTKDKKVYVYEIMSKTDQFDNLMQRNMEVIKRLPEEMIPVKDAVDIIRIPGVKYKD